MTVRYRRELSIAGVWALLLALLALQAPSFYSSDQLRNVLVSAAPLLIAAAGTTLVMIARQIDISIGSVFSACGVAAGLTAAGGVPMPLVVVACLTTGALLGAVNGLLVARLRLPAIVVTLSTLVAVRESVRYLREGEFVRNLPEGFQWFGFGQVAGQWTVVSIAVVACGLTAWGLAYLTAGRTVYATGSDPEAARLVGIRPRRVIFGVFVASGVFTGLAALCHSVRFADVDPNAGSGFEMQGIAAVVLGGTSVTGGRGTMAGTAIAVLLLATIGPALVFLHVQPQWERAIQGLIILAAVASDAVVRDRK